MGLEKSTQTWCCCCAPVRPIRAGYLTTPTNKNYWKFSPEGWKNRPEIGKIVLRYYSCWKVLLKFGKILQCLYNRDRLPYFYTFLLITDWLPYFCAFLLKTDILSYFYAFKLDKSSLCRCTAPWTLAWWWWCSLSVASSGWWGSSSSTTSATSATGQRPKPTTQPLW